MVYDLNATEQYIRRAAQARGINPDIAVRVAKSEGLARGTWQSNLSKNGQREPSYGPFQLLVGGEGTNYPAGMGNDFKRATGLDPSDPANVNATIDFALDGAAKNGWGAWYGAKHAGIGNRDGIGGAKPVGPGAGPSPLTQAVAERGGAGSSTLAGGAGGDQLATGGSGPVVNIGLPSEREGKAAEAMIAAGNRLGSNAQNGWDAIGGLAQVWAGNRMSAKAEAGEASALQKAIAGLDPEYAMAAQLMGGREGAAQAIMSQNENRTAAATRAEARADRLAAQEYDRSQDALANARADQTLAIQQQTAEDGRVPPGYRRTETGMEPIPGGPADPAVASAKDFRTLTPDEVTARGLPAGQYQVGPNDRVYPIGDGKGSSVTVVNGQSNKFREKADERMVARFGTLADGGTAAAETAQTIPVMRELLAQAPNGPIAGALAERFKGYSTAGDAFQATVNQIAPSLRIPGSGAQSDRDMDILLGSFPRLGNDPNANQIIMGVFEKKAQLNMQRADIASQALRGEIDPATADQRLSELDRVSILDDNMRSFLSGKAPEAPGGAPNAPTNYRDKYGLE